MTDTTMTTTYYVTRDDVLVRKLEGWRTQVWKPRSKEWADFDVDVGTEATEITDPEVVADLEKGNLGDFAPTGGTNG